MRTKELESALDRFEKILEKAKGQEIVIFLDYDGTLTPIVSHPENANLSQSMRDVIRDLSSVYTVAVISGRDLQDVKERVALKGILYAGSHGFDIVGPNDVKHELAEAKQILPIMKDMVEKLNEIAESYQGVQIESKKFSIALHYRNVEEQKKESLKKKVIEEIQHYPDLKIGSGKEVLDIGPNIDWHKGKAVEWLLDQLSLKKRIFTIYIGDDLTDENAFDVVESEGIGIVVFEEKRETKANYFLKNPNEVQKFLQRLIEIKNE